MQFGPDLIRWFTALFDLASDLALLDSELAAAWGGSADSSGPDSGCAASSDSGSGLICQPPGMLRQPGCFHSVGFHAGENFHLCRLVQLGRLFEEAWRARQQTPEHRRSGAARTAAEPRIQAAAGMERGMALAAACLDASSGEEDNTSAAAFPCRKAVDASASGKADRTAEEDNEEEERTERADPAERPSWLSSLPVCERPGRGQNPLLQAQLAQERQPGRNWWDLQCQSWPSTDWKQHPNRQHWKWNCKQEQEQKREQRQLEQEWRQGQQLERELLIGCWASAVSG